MAQPTCKTYLPSNVSRPLLHALAASRFTVGVGLVEWPSGIPLGRYPVAPGTSDAVLGFPGRSVSARCACCAWSASGGAVLGMQPSDWSVST